MSCDFGDLALLDAGGRGGGGVAGAVLPAGFWGVAAGPLWEPVGSPQRRGPFGAVAWVGVSAQWADWSSGGALSWCWSAPRARRSVP